MPREKEEILITVAVIISYMALAVLFINMFVPELTWDYISKNENPEFLYVDICRTDGERYVTLEFWDSYNSRDFFKISEDEYTVYYFPNDSATVRRVSDRRRDIEQYQLPVWLALKEKTILIDFVNNSYGNITYDLKPCEVVVILYLDYVREVL